MTFTVRHVSWNEEKTPIMALRTRIFMEEQGVSRELELDGLDEVTATEHFLGYLNNTPIATGRLLADGQIGRICVDKAHRQQGYATKLLRHITRHVLGKSNFPQLWLHAQVSVLGLYKKCGFQPHGELFIEADIEHRAMHFDHYEQEALEALFGNDVIRLHHAYEFAQHLTLMSDAAKRQVIIFSQNLSSQIYNQTVTDAISKLARRHRQTQIRILVQNTQNLRAAHHPLVALSQRLSSSITLHQLHESPQHPDEGFAIIDQKHLLFFNDESALKGFANYRATPEAKKYLDEFDSLWHHHSGPDPDLQTFVI